MKTIKDLLIELSTSGEPMVDGLSEWAEPIADYLRENGGVVLPVRIGQTVYVVDKTDIDNPIKEQIVVEIKFGYARNVFVLQSRPTCVRINHAFYDFERTVFSSYDEAQQALKKR